MLSYKESSDFFAVLDCLPVGAVILRADLTVVVWNKVLEDWTGVSAWRIVGNSIIDFFPNFDQQRYRDCFNDVFVGRGPVILSEQEYGCILPSDVSSQRECQQQGRLVCLSMAEPGGPLALLTVKNISDWAVNNIEGDHAAEVKAALERVEQQNRQLWSVVDLSLIEIDRDYRIVDMNPTAERTLGIRKCDVIGSLVNETGFDWDWEQVRGSLDECWANGGTVCLGRMCFSGSAGKTGVMDISINRTSAIGDDQAGLLLVGSDVSAYAVLEDQLQEHSRLEAIGQLTSGIAHEINTPVQYVGDNAQFVGECFDDIVALVGLCRKLLDSSGQGDGDPRLLKEMRQFLEDIDIDYMLSEVPAAIRQSLEGVRQISSIVGAMKEFVHPWGAEKNKVDLNGLIQSTITVARNEWKYVAEVETDFDSTLPPVMCMPGEINQVILNLIVNAVDAIGDVVSNGENGKGAIRISTKWDGDWVEIRVADTGAGIPEDVYGHIFEPFFTTKQCGKGSGQGLAISRRLIVENHQGTLDLESEVGKGTVCIIRLPVGHGDNDLDQELLGIIGDKR